MKNLLELVPDHHDLGKKDAGVAFEPYMLDWPFFITGGDKEITDNVFITIHRNALKALTMIGPFRAEISLGVDRENKKLIKAYRTWGMIYLNNKCVLTFSHDTRKSNVPFTSLVEWTELNDYPIENWELIKKIVFSWTVDQWVSFFKTRILKKADSLASEAKQERAKVSDLEDNQIIILRGLADSFSIV